MQDPLRELDLHGYNCYQAEIAIEAALRNVFGLYRLRLIHGYRNGTVLKNFIRRQYGDDPRILRLEAHGQGATDMVLKELF